MGDSYRAALGSGPPYQKAGAVRELEDALLPLSWGRAAGAPLLTQVHLPLSGFEWLTWADLPPGYSFNQLYREHLAHWRGGFVIRGCSPAIARYLAARGCRVVRAGYEALLDLAAHGLGRRAVLKMCRQARRYGAVCELPWSPQAAAALRTFARQTRHGGRPQLQHLFRTEFAAGLRLFVFIAATGEWQGALLLTQPHANGAVAELLLRGVAAPGGVMEQLIYDTSMRLRSEGRRWLSLNEVPFVGGSGCRAPLERLLHLAGRLLQPAYNTAGLLRFKAKFAPLWRPVYLCASTGRLPLALAEMFIATGCLRLSADTLWQTVRPYLPGAALLSRPSPRRGD